jgi:hypothetical protein
MSSVDFAEVKSAATVEQVIGFLGLKLTQKEDSFRGVCPLCKSGSREFVITGSKKLFHCFKCKKGGDMLKLVSEAKGIGVKEAAAELAKACGVEKKSTPAPTEKKAFDVDKYAEGLDPEHKALEPLGLSADTLRAWKAGPDTQLPGSTEEDLHYRYNHPPASSDTWEWRSIQTNQHSFSRTALTLASTSLALGSLQERRSTLHRHRSMFCMRGITELPTSCVSSLKRYRARSGSTFQLLWISSK